MAFQQNFKVQQLRHMRRCTSSARVVPSCASYLKIFGSDLTTKTAFPYYRPHDEGIAVCDMTVTVTVTRFLVDLNLNPHRPEACEASLFELFDMCLWIQ